MSEADIPAAQEQPKRNRVPLVTYLVQSPKAHPLDLAMLASMEFAMLVFDFAALDPELLLKGWPMKSSSASIIPYP